MTEGVFLNGAARRYWKYALWLTAGVTLLALLTINVASFSIRVEHFVVAVAYSLLSSAWMSALVGKATKERKMPMGQFLFYGVVRLLVALALIVVYMLVTGLRGRLLLPFVGLLSLYFIVIDVLDAAFLVKLQKELEKA